MSDLLNYQVDDYDCVQIIDERLLLNPCDTKWFDRILNKSMEHWIEKKYKAIWLQVSSPKHLHLLPYIGKHDFYPHHCQPHYIMFVKWINPKRSNQLPVSPQHVIGVGAVVINAKNQILMVQETTGPAAKFKVWKLPGGLVDSNEILSNAVVRELKEETGVDAKFKTWCCTIEMMRRDTKKDDLKSKNINSFYVRNPARGSKSRDIYCMCLCELIGNENEIKLIKQQNEIADLRWFDIADIFKMPLWKINVNGQTTGVWGKALQTCVDIHFGKKKGFTHQITPFAFNRGEASLYQCKL